MVPYVDKVCSFLKSDCKVKDTDTSVKAYIFGCKNLGLNQIFIELKKELFYNKELKLNPNTFLNYFFEKVRKIMIKEKSIMTRNSNLDAFNEKWESFRPIYDYLGPDNQIVG